MNLGVVILCRMSSSRLPGKVLMEVKGKVIIQHIFDRVSKVFDEKNIVIGTSQDSSDDEIENYCNKNNIQIGRGSLENVSKRFLDIAKSRDWDYVIRINGDNLFIDTDTLATLKDKAESGDYDFISNVKGRTFPYGMSIEVIKVNYYQELYETLIKDNDDFREHVTLCLYEDNTPGNKYFHYNEICPEAKGLKFAVDTREDLEKVERIINNVSEDYTLSELVKEFKNEIE